MFEITTCSGLFTHTVKINVANYYGDKRLQERHTESLCIYSTGTCTSNTSILFFAYDIILNIWDFLLFVWESRQIKHCNSGGQTVFIWIRHLLSVM
jgi:hypothetical protein